LRVAVLIALAVFFVVSGWHLYQWVTGVEERFAQLDRSIQQTNETLADVTNALSVLAARNQQLQAQLEQTQQSQQQSIAQTRRQFSTQLQDLQTDIQSKVGKAAISDLVNTWQHRVARISCIFSGQGERGQSKGSAVAIKRNGHVQFVTNRHVVFKDGYQREGCVLRLPESDEEYEIAADNVHVIDEPDVAYVDLATNPSRLVQEAAQVQQCRSRPQIGQRIVILGYPNVGADNGITVTEGIVSGYSDLYYITSAKIEQGNSGGAAVSVKEDCFLGMPTLAVAGRLESLARILPAPEL